MLIFRVVRYKGESGEEYGFQIGNEDSMQDPTDGGSCEPVLEKKIFSPMTPEQGSALMERVKMEFTEDARILGIHKVIGLNAR